MFAVIGDALYPKLPFLLYKGHQKGIQRIKLSEPKEVQGEWICEAKIFPKVPVSLLTEILHLPEDERKAIWEHYSEPTTEWGRASKENVANQTMHKWLPEMSRKRAAARALKLYAGIGQTAYEEMPQATLTKEELESDDDSKIITIEASPERTIPANSEPKQDEERCKCGCLRKLHVNDGKEFHCMACIRAGKEIKCNLPPGR
jgi:hypothetical protein